ncbi:MAG: hypothetical protein ACFFCO_08465 [Promethearchaeota archaeon]
MDLALRFLLMIGAVLLLSSASLIILFSRRTNILYRFNALFLEFFGVKEHHPSWLRWLTSSLLGSAAASLLLVLLVNVADAIIQLSLLSGIGLDPAAVPLLVGMVILSCLLIVCAGAIVLVSPIASPIALAILSTLHAFAYRLTSPLSWPVTILFFCVILTGVVCTIISLYLLLRRFMYPALLRMRRN